MDLSLDDLLSGLQQAQQKKSKARLSDRNVIELVNKLKSMGLLGDDLLYTTNGREYVTRDHLSSEVCSALSAAGGRMSVVDLPAALGVDLSHCTYAAEQASKDSTLRITLSQGELFSPIYIDNLASEVEEILSTEGGGATTISELALRFGLAADLLTSFIKPKLSSRDIKAKLDGGVIYTDSFITRLKAQVRGALRAAATPVPLSTLTKTLTTSSSSSGALVTSLLPSIIEELSNTDKKKTSSSDLSSQQQQQQPLQGKLSAGTWIPHCFVQSQQEGIKAAYAQNGYLTYDAVAKQGGGGGGQQSPKQFLQQTFPDGIALSECFISPVMVQQVESAIEEMIMSSLQQHDNNDNNADEDRGGWCDVLSMVPADISSFDAASILEKALKGDVLSRKKGEVSVLVSTVVMMNSLVEEIKSMVVEQAGKDAVEDVQKKKKVKGEEKVGGGGGVSSVQSSKKQQQQVDDDDDGDDDDWSMSKNNKRGGKKGKKAAAGGGVGGGRGGGGKKGASKGTVTTAPTSSSTTPTITTVPGIQAFIIQKYPDFEGSGADGELPTALATLMRPAAAAEYERASQAIFTAGADNRRKLRDAASRELEESHKKLQIYAHGIELFSDDEGTVVLSRHLLRTVGSDCCDAVLRCVAADFDNVEVSTAEQKAKLIKQLPNDQKAATQSMMTALNGSGSGIEMVGVFIAELEKAAETAAGVWLKKLDKKAEKQLVFAHWKGLEEKLMDEGQDDGAAALAVLVPMLMGKMHGRAVSLPGRALSAAVEKLKGDLPADQHALLVKFHGAVVELLKGGGEGGGDDGGGGLVEMLEEVKGTKWGSGGA